MNLAGKWMKLKKDPMEYGNPGSERQIPHVISH